MIIVTISVLSFRVFVQRQKSLSLIGGILGGIVNTITIIIMNGVWRRVAFMITKWGEYI